jgi:hypothetical protein
LGTIDSFYLAKENNEDNSHIHMENSGDSIFITKFPLEVFPTKITNFVKEVSESLQCPIDFIAVPLLVCAATAIGTSKEIEVKEGWREGPRFYCAIVAEPGSKKTPALSRALSVIYEMQNEIEESYKKDLINYENEKLLYEVALDNWRRNAKSPINSSINPPVKPNEPRGQQLITTDATWEALAETLENNPRGILFHRDELSGWVKGMDQYRAKGADRQNWLSIWSGESITINRKGRRTNITRPLVNVIGGIQPDVLEDLIDQGREDGFVDRILFSFPHSFPSYWTDKGISTQLIQNYKEVIQRLFKEQKQIIKMDEDAKSLFKVWHDELQKEINYPGFPVNLKGAWSKFVGYSVRLVLVVHCLRYECNETQFENIDKESMRLTIKLMNYFKSHTKKVYDILKADEQTKNVIRAVNYIKEKGVNGVIKLRDFQKSNVCGVKTKSDVLKIFTHMENLGYGKIESKDNVSGRKSIFFKLE